jgi:hypothetical protein
MSLAFSLREKQGSLLFGHFCAWKGRKSDPCNEIYIELNIKGEKVY